MAMASNQDGAYCYWKLPTYSGSKKPEMVQQLNNLGFHEAKNSHSKDHLQLLLQRYHRGLLQYNRCADEELYAFLCARDRVSSYPHPHPPFKPKVEVRSTVIRQLEQLDEPEKAAKPAVGRFFRFMDLASELRNMVYKHYVHDLPAVLRTPTKPPISRVCRQVRHEFLPVFFAGKTIEIRLQQEDATRHRFKEENATRLFFLNLTDLESERIRRFKVVIDRHDANINSDTNESKIYCNITLGIDENEVVVEPAAAGLHAWWDRQMRNDARAAIAAHVASLQTKGRRSVFSKEKLHGLRRVIEESAVVTIE